MGRGAIPIRWLERQINSEDTNQEIKSILQTTYEYWRDEADYISKTCDCEYNDLEDGDTLYVYNSWDGGIMFDAIHDIHFCPYCGKRLPVNDR